MLTKKELDALVEEQNPTLKVELGKLCKRQHRFMDRPWSIRFRSDGSCKECRNTSSKNWNKANPEKCQEWRLNWRLENPEKYKNSYTNWKKQNAEKTIQTTRIWEKNNPEKHKELMKKTNQRRRTRKRGGFIEAFTTDDLIRRYRKDFNRCCAYCGIFLYYNQVQWDHVVAIAKGGSHTLDNLVPSCAACNSSKQDFDVFDWLRKKSYEIPLWLPKD